MSRIGDRAKLVKPLPTRTTAQRSGSRLHGDTPQASFRDCVDGDRSLFGMDGFIAGLSFGFHSVHAQIIFASHGSWMKQAIEGLAVGRGVDHYVVRANHGGRRTGG